MQGREMDVTNLPELPLLFSPVCYPIFFEVRSVFPFSSTAVQQGPPPLGKTGTPPSAFFLCQDLSRCFRDIGYDPRSLTHLPRQHPRSPHPHHPTLSPLPPPPPSSASPPSQHPPPLILIHLLRSSLPHSPPPLHLFPHLNLPPLPPPYPSSLLFPTPIYLCIR